MSISKPIPLGYKEGFEDMDLDHNGKLDAKEVFNMMKKVLLWIVYFQCLIDCNFPILTWTLKCYRVKI